MKKCGTFRVYLALLFHRLEAPEGKEVGDLLREFYYGLI